MSDLSKEIRKHAATWPPHLRKRINCQRLLAAAEEIEELESKIAELRKSGRHAHHDQTRPVRDDEQTNR